MTAGVPVELRRGGRDQATRDLPPLPRPPGLGSADGPVDGVLPRLVLWLADVAAEAARTSLVGEPDAVDRKRSR